MIKFNKLILKTLAFSSVLTPFALVSCIESDYTKNKLKIPQGFKYIPKDYNSAEAKTSEILESILNQQFKNNDVAKTNFLKSQEDTKKLLSEFKELSKTYKFEKSNENAEKLRSFYSQNWLFLLKNIDNFQWKYTNWWTFPSIGEARHSETFLEKISSQIIPDNYRFINNYWESLTVGDESPESPDDVFYLKKDKMIVRVFITRNKKSVKKLIFDKFILFPRARNERIAVKLISDSVHNAIIHGNQDGYDTFENDVIKNYSYPALGLLLTKENDEN
ncbi:hypothetical protein MCAL160_0414 [Mycoplasmopsis californica HAZ160_1]|uniref:Lipoprotein n=1 Tax=Mycoplasmopsis californica HAZ160_1 TaxID=1397850 RepID=A0AAT9F7X7_9BACT|nr:aromatic motif membrane protein [Mycoplasmopsis californica]BAP01004.1 hypothetical protein MCAL160_0414 [Mycoplasmopsis californica HAZ160_1]BBG40869.1 hypothetical protein MCAL106_0414 [Mycoplasmopsis californica]BBG41463.1 hypothetical protein MCAL106E_0414 [Mycoplasmopsis californica]BBG42056.1 hypothetical protein MCAL106L_0414 [Mycoplasmopsis californica]BBG42639.1 hypothetical protein MCAL160E_0414 [Mycoplasmopsis californica]